MSRMLERDKAALVVVDVQEAFRAAIDGFDRVVRNTDTLARGAKVLGLPVVVTEQYPRGLGETVPELQEALDGAPRTEKVVFSAARADGFDLGDAEQVLVCGIETHVCVSQTVHDLLGRGLDVHVAADAVGSRAEDNRQVGLHRMERAGATISSTEMALLELVGAAGTDEFKQIQRLIK